MIDGRFCIEVIPRGLKKLLDYNIAHILDANGEEVGSYEYDAWGNILSVTGGEIAELNPYRYRGYRYDAETGLYYLQSRYYNPVWGRFINGDLLVGSGQMANMFAYCFNNPVNLSDCNGMEPVSITLAIVAGVVSLGVLTGLVCQASYDITSGQKFKSRNYVAAGIGGGTAAGVGIAMLATGASSFLIPLAVPAVGVGVANVTRQGINIKLGDQDSFDWTNLGYEVFLASSVALYATGMTYGTIPDFSHIVSRTDVVLGTLAATVSGAFVGIVDRLSSPSHNTSTTYRGGGTPSYSLQSLLVH